MVFNEALSTPPMSWNALSVYLASLSVSKTVRSDKVLKRSKNYSVGDG